MANEIIHYEQFDRLDFMPIQTTNGPAEPRIKFATLSYLDHIIEPEQWNDFVEYVNEVFSYDLSVVPPDALFSITDMLEWADSYRGI